MSLYFCRGRCFGPAFAAASTVASNRLHASGRVSIFVNGVTLGHALGFTGNFTAMTKTRKKHRANSTPQPPTPKTPKAPKPWDPPTSCVVGDEDDRKTFAAVGYALTRWEHFEQSLGHLFVAIVSVSPSREAMRAYGSIMNSKGRLEMIGAAAASFFISRKGDNIIALKQRLDDQLKAAVGFATRRNEIAHGIVQLKLGEVPEHDDFDLDNTSWVLAPSFYNTKKRKMQPMLDSELISMPPVYEYSSIEIQAIAEKFAALRTPTERLALAIRRVRYLERQASPRKLQ